MPGYPSSERSYTPNLRADPNLLDGIDAEKAGRILLELGEITEEEFLERQKNKKPFVPVSYVQVFPDKKEGR